MTVNKFVETYKEKTLLGEPLEIGTTSLRNYINANKDDMEKEGLVKFSKKLKTVSVKIINPEGLYKKLA